VSIVRLPHSASTDTILDLIPHGVAVLDQHGTVTTANDRWRWARGDGDPVVADVGTPLLAHLRTGDPPSPVAEHIADGLGRLLDGRGSSFQVQYQVTGGDEPRWFLVAAEHLPDGGVVITRTDTTVHHGVNEVLAELAFHDDLTGLPNRGLLQDRVRMALIRAQRLGLRPLILFTDLVGFKAVNDRHGHEAGDLVLIETARRLSAAVREGDTCGRWGGDEFVALLPAAGPLDAERAVERLETAVASIELHSHRLGVDIGIATYPEDGVDLPELLRVADARMYARKARHKGALRSA